MDLSRSFTIREASHRIHNPFTSEKLATLGRPLSPPPGTAVLDLACGTGEMLCTWARDHQLTCTAPARYVRYRREYLGWGVVALMDR